MTAKEMVLAAMERLSGECSLADIVVAAWKAHPDAFGLKGHKEYPDAVRVYTCFHGPSGLVKRGKVVQIGPKRFCLASRYRPADPRLAKLMGTAAVRKWQQGLARTVTEAEAVPILCEHTEWLLSHAPACSERQLLHDLRGYLVIRYGKVSSR